VRLNNLRRNEYNEIESLSRAHRFNDKNREYLPFERLSGK
jgi:hypothetical protein